MTIERIIRIMAGFFVLLSLALGYQAVRFSFRNGSWPLPLLLVSICCKAALPVFALPKNCLPKWASNAAAVVAAAKRDNEWCLQPRFNTLA